MDFSIQLEISPLEVALTGAAQLATLTNKRGRFKYRYNPDTGETFKGYNALRHCGAIWAMLDVNETGRADKDVLAACNRASLYLQNKFVRLYHRQDWLCFLEGNSIKLGGAGLAILALLATNKVSGDELLEITIRRLGAFVLSQQDEEGDFVHKRYFKSGKVSDFRSDYYTGEALLALLMLKEVSGEERWIEAVEKCENFLCPQDYGVAEQSHWMLYALELLCRHRKKKDYYDHATKIARHILDFPEYRDWGRSTPMACRSEGLLAFLRTPAPTEKALDHDFRQRCLEAVKENLALQMAFRRPDGAFIRGGGDRRHNEVRIDYTQHNISSFLHFSRLAKQSPA